MRTDHKKFVLPKETRALIEQFNSFTSSPVHRWWLHFHWLTKYGFQNALYTKQASCENITKWRTVAF